MKEEMEHKQAVEMTEVEESEVEWGWRSEAGSWFQTHGEAYRKEMTFLTQWDHAVPTAASLQRCQLANTPIVRYWLRPAWDDGGCWY